jgi:hypothetical protein
MTSRESGIFVPAHASVLLGPALCVFVGVAVLRGFGQSSRQLCLSPKAGAFPGRWPGRPSSLIAGCAPGWSVYTLVCGLSLVDEVINCAGGNRRVDT